MLLILSMHALLQSYKRMCKTVVASSVLNNVFKQYIEQRRWFGYFSHVRLRTRYICSTYIFKINDAAFKILKKRCEFKDLKKAMVYWLPYFMFHACLMASKMFQLC